MFLLFLCRFVNFQSAKAIKHSFHRVLNNKKESIRIYDK